MGFQYTEGIYKILWVKNTEAEVINCFWGVQEMCHKENNAYLGLQGRVGVSQVGR